MVIYEMLYQEFLNGPEYLCFSKVLIRILSLVEHFDQTQ